MITKKIKKLLILLSISLIALPSCDDYYDEKHKSQYDCMIIKI